MSSRSAISGVLFAALSTTAVAPSNAAAEAATSSSARALFTARGFEQAELALLEDALSRAIGVRLIDAGDVTGELGESARALGADPNEVAAELLRAAREAFVELRLGPAKEAYRQALDLILAGDRRPADSKELAAIFFERALVSLAAHARDAAERDLLTTAIFDPTFAPNADVYGPPVMRAFQRAKLAAAKLPQLSLKIDRAPREAIVRIDGRAVPPGETVQVRGRGPHLVTAERNGYKPRSQLIQLEARGPSVEAIVLERASGPLLAAHALDAWRERERAASGDPLAGELGLMIARTLGITQVVEASRSDGGAIDVVLRDAASGEISRSVRGKRVEWEPYAYAAIAASLAGRTLEPPPEPVELTMTLSAPNRVEPGAAIPLRVDVRDPGRKLARLEASCSGEPGANKLAADLMKGDRDQSVHTLLFTAPEDETTLACAVHGLDAAGAPIVTAPPAGERVEIAVVDEAIDWYERWYVWGAIGAAVAGGTALAFVLRPEAQPPEQVLVIDGPR